MRVLAFGEILWDVIDGMEHLGGAPFNFAAHAAQCGNESFIISRVGKDALGERALELAQNYGVHTTFVQFDDEHPTGIVDVTLSKGQPDYFIRENTAYDHISGEVLSTLKGQQFDVFYFGSLAQRNRQSASTLLAILDQHRFRHVFYDVNLRKNGFTEDIIRRSLSRSSIVKLNLDEVEVLSKMLWGKSLEAEEFCRALRSGFPAVKLILVTAAEKGCYIFEDRLEMIPGKTVEVCDAVGAGDAFSAAFMHVYVLTGDPVASARVANQVGAFVATKAGPIPVYTPEIKKLLGST